jgi:glutamine amidotransferase
MVQSRSDQKGKRHGHGWGIAAYENTQPLVYRRAWDAYHNEEFKDAAARTYATTVIAHVRRATVGGATLANTHPFTDDVWSMAHNGTVPHFDEVRPRLLAEMSLHHRSAVEGETDSEHVFRLIMSRIPKDGLLDAVTSTVLDVVEWSRANDPGAAVGLNLLITDGHDLVGVRHGRGLFVARRVGVTDCDICRYPHVAFGSGDDSRALVVASEPLTSSEAWQEIPEASVFTIDADVNFRLMSLADGGHDIPLGSSTRVRTAVRSTLTDEFMIDHRAMAEGFWRLERALSARDVAAATAEADRIDRISGAHIAFEESDLYPALKVEHDMYEDHDAGLRVLQRLASPDTGLDHDQIATSIAETRQIRRHMEDCGALMTRVRELSAADQSALESRLLQWREEAPLWSDLHRLAVAETG